MTIEEKRKAIQEYCHTQHPNGCTHPDTCPILGNCVCYSSFVTYELINENYNVLFGQPTLTTKDNVNHPTHYETGKFECIDVMIETQGIEAVEDFCICNAFKYIYRHGNKNGIEDVKKAIWYLNKYVELTEGSNEV